MRLQLPQKANGAVEVAHGSFGVRVALRDSRSASQVVVTGSRATYADAREGVDLLYDALGSGLKETIELHSAKAPTTYTFDVAAPGLTAVSTSSGAVAFEDRDGHVRFQFAPPWMSDADGRLSRAARFELGREDAGEVAIRLLLDDAWLHDPQRTFPVKVDPTVWATPFGVCELVSGGAADVSDCGPGERSAWIGRSGREVHRVAVYVDPSVAVPADATVLGAQLDASFAAQNVSEPSQLDLHWLTTEFDAGATWNSAAPGVAWRTAGGDLATPATSTRTLSPGDVGDWVGLVAPRLVQAWLDGSKPIDGLVIKAHDESCQHVDVLEDYVLKVRYHDRTGFVGQREHWLQSDRRAQHPLHDQTRIVIR